MTTWYDNGHTVRLDPVQEYAVATHPDVLLWMFEGGTHLYLAGWHAEPGTKVGSLGVEICTWCRARGKGYVSTLHPRRDGGRGATWWETACPDCEAKRANNQ